MSQNTVTAGKVVSIHYTLTDPSGEVIDSSAGGEPLSYLHGAENIVPGLERQLEGKVVGDKFEAVVPPSEGYGERQGPGPQPIPLQQLPPQVAAGMQLMGQTQDGQRFPVWVVGLTETHALVDQEHPLAGVTLHFAVEVTRVRDASSEEMQHGHPHGPGGHHH